MLSYAVKRLVTGFAVIVFVSFGIFVLTNIAVDPAVALAGDGASAADIEATRKAYGFDRPVLERYANWLGQIVSGDLGDSYRERRPVLELLGERLPVTLWLGLASLAVALLISIPTAVISALRPGSAIDRAALFVAMLGQGMPTFWLSLLLVQFFSLYLGWLPISGSSTASSFVLPALALGSASAPVIMRLTRAGMIEVLGSDYIRMARAKGLRSGTILWKHALRNAIVPAVSVAAVQFGFMLGGSIVVETIFAMQGIGYLAWTSISLGDLPVIQAIILLTSFFYVTLMILADLLNAWLDPTLRSR